MKYPINNHKPRGDHEIKGVLVHSMAEFIQTPDGPVFAPDFLEETGLGVHAIITPMGEVYECVETVRATPHAGLSMFEGLKWLNRYFLGFELLVQGVHDYGSFLKALRTSDPYTDEQYRAAAELTHGWMEEFDIPESWIVGHSDVSGEDVRGEGKGKRDPGPHFDWGKFNQILGDL